MDTWLWIVLGIVAVPVFWWTAKVATAFVVPISVTGRTYLKQALRRNAIDPRTIPEACIDEFVEFANQTAFHPLGGALPVRPVQSREEFVHLLDTFAALFVLWRREPGDSMFQEHGGRKNVYREIFERYGIK